MNIHCHRCPSQLNGKMETKIMFPSISVKSILQTSTSIHYCWANFEIFHFRPSSLSRILRFSISVCYHLTNLEIYHVCLLLLSKSSKISIFVHFRKARFSKFSLNSIIIKGSGFLCHPLGCLKLKNTQRTPHLLTLVNSLLIIHVLILVL